MEVPEATGAHSCPKRFSIQLLELTPKSGTRFLAQAESSSCRMLAASSLRPQELHLTHFRWLFPQLLWQVTIFWWPGQIAVAFFLPTKSVILVPFQPTCPQWPHNRPREAKNPKELPWLPQWPLTVGPATLESGSIYQTDTEGVISGLS